MNRKLKFRIYNTTRKEFSFLELFNGKNANIHTTPDVERSSNFEHPQEFTGLLDKNKKEIYEGDFVSDKKTIFKVEWNQQQSGFWTSIH